jgi:hypothetical protein
LVVAKVEVVGAIKLGKRLVLQSESEALEDLRVIGGECGGTTLSTSVGKQSHSKLTWTESLYDGRDELCVVLSGGISLE